jgi:hypothetical protein
VPRDRVDLRQPTFRLKRKTCFEFPQESDKKTATSGKKSNAAPS